MLNLLRYTGLAGVYFDKKCDMSGRVTYALPFPLKAAGCGSAMGRDGRECSVSVRMWPFVYPRGAELVIYMFRAKKARLEVMSGWKISAFSGYEILDKSLNLSEADNTS